MTSISGSPPVRRARVRVIAATLFCCLFAAGDAAAQGNADADTLTQNTKVFGAELTYPMPSWVTGKRDAYELLQESFVAIQQDAEQYYQAQTPAGTTLRDAVRVYSISGIDLSYIGRDVSLQTFIGTLAPAFSGRCGPETFGTQNLDEIDDAATLLVYCTKFKSSGGQSKFGRGDHTAFLSLVRVLKYGNAFIQVTHDWFGPAYDFADQASWPVSTEELDRMCARYRLIAISDRIPQ